MSLLGQSLLSKNRRRLALFKLIYRICSPRFYASFKAQPYALHRLSAGPSVDLTCTKEDALKFYRTMSIMRRMEQSLATMYTAKLVRGFCHLYSGQEAIATGVHESIKPEDHVITAYRCHGYTYLMGVSIEGVMAELTGRVGGVVRGKGGSMHMYGKNFYGGNGIVGAHVPIGVGTAFACKYLGSGGVGYVIYGDGAANQGQVSESFNMAQLWKLPVVYICENNLYGMGTSMQRASANTEFYTRGDLIPGIKCDGMDVLAVREATKFGKDYALKNGPIIIEALSYRYFGHSMSDPGTSYRTRDEIQEVRQNKDPITSFKSKIIEAKLVTEDEIKALDTEAKAIVDKATEFAKTNKEADETELVYDIYSHNLHEKIRNNLHWNSLDHKNIGSAINLK